MSDYYTTLGVTKNSSPEEIKKAYRKLAHQHHPDKQGGDEKKFKEINEAYQVLSDQNKRAQYDQFGSAFQQGGGQGAGFGGFDFSDFMRGAQGEAVDVEITLEGAFAGVERTFELKRMSRCGHCSGTGAEPGTPIKSCATCSGS